MEDSKRMWPFFVGVLLCIALLTFLVKRKNSSHFNEENKRFTMAVVTDKRHTSKGRACIFEFEFEGNKYSGYTKTSYLECIPGDSIRIMFSALDPNYSFHSPQ